MKCVYIYSTNDKDYKSSGEAKKVLSQVDAFKENGVDVIFLDVVLNKKIYKILYRLPFVGVYPIRFINKCKQVVFDCDFVYIRKNIFDSTYLKLLKSIKKSNPSIKIFVEIPSYPYIAEWNRQIDKPFIIKEKLVVPKITKLKLVDYYLTLTDDKEIYGLPTIKFENCVTLKNYSIKENKQCNDSIHLIGVALVAYWHGYDRIIRGLKNYYNKTQEKNVYFHIVGDGPEIPNLKKIASEYKLSPYVIFEGKKFGQELDELYNKCHIAIGCLGLYRKGVYSSNSLKTREYCAKGIPFILSRGELIFENQDFTFVVPNDDSVINIESVCNFISKIDYTTVSNKMRNYAEKHLDWNGFVNDILVKIN